jgi:hypothetical protein
MTIQTFARVASLAILTAAVLAVPLAAQFSTGSVGGTVTDAQGAVIPGAKVTLISETKSTALTPAIANSSGDFNVTNVAPDTYTVEVEMESFRTLKRSGLTVNPGARTDLGNLTLAVGATSDVISVTGEAPLVQTSSAENSFTVQTEATHELPISNRNFTGLAQLAPGVSGTARIGGGGSSNYMMDGVDTVDTGNNGVLLGMSTESIAEVKIVTSSYQAEYGRASGLQISAVTKSGSNKFHGSVYDVERHGRLNFNSKTNILNGVPKPVLNERDWGFSIGGPVGKFHSTDHKLFFFFTTEFDPRNQGGNTVYFRVPTAAERAGDFSQSLDNNGLPYPYIKDPAINGTCSSASAAACFNSGGVGKIPSSRLYQTGVNVLSLYPTPNITGSAGAGLPYNFQIVEPNQSALAYTPTLKLDYLPSSRIRVSLKGQGFWQRNDVFLGTIPGFNDDTQQHPVITTYATTVDYTINPSTILEVTTGRSQNERSGCAPGGGTLGPVFCAAGLPTSKLSSTATNGLKDLPLLFPNARVIPKDYYAYQALGFVADKLPAWQGGQFLLPPSFSWGNRINSTYAPPNFPFPGYLNINTTYDLSMSLTKVKGTHTIKGGYYFNRGYKGENFNPSGGGGTATSPFGLLSFANDTPGVNPYDTSFGFANAAVGSFSSYVQTSRYTEGKYLNVNDEFYLQDNWKFNHRLTLDYGIRIVHMSPEKDGFSQASNFLANTYKIGQAPLLYQAGCVGASPCSGSNRQALNPATGQLLGPTSSFLIGALVPNTGNLVNGMYAGPDGKGTEESFTYPFVNFSPRLGLAWDVTGRQKFVIRAGGGIFTDRPSTTQFRPINNPPLTQVGNARYGQLQSLTGGLSAQNVPVLNPVIQPAMSYPTSAQWNIGFQTSLPKEISFSFSWYGTYSWHQIQLQTLNSVDLGSAFSTQGLDPTAATSTTPGAASYAATAPDLARAIRGYGQITQISDLGWRRYQSLQLSVQRRFAHGVSFGLNDTIGLYDHMNTPQRLQHLADGTTVLRADQSQADALLGNNAVVAHTINGNWVWALPKLPGRNSSLKMAGYLVNDWQLSGLWSASTGAAYTVSSTYSNGNGSVNITGSPDYAARIRVLSDPGSGCGSSPYKQFNTAAFAGPLVGSVGLDSGTDYLRGCFQNNVDMALARNIHIHSERFTAQIRMDIFNVFNQAIVTGRNTTMQLASATGDQTAITNLPYDASGNLIASRSQPKTAGFGVANTYQNPRTFQLQLRFAF